MSQPAPAYYLYVLRCADNSLYTGVTTDVARREREHNSSPKGAKYTAARRPVRVVYTETYADRSSAQVAESAFKKQSRADKLAAISHSQAALRHR